MIDGSDGIAEAVQRQCRGLLSVAETYLTTKCLKSYQINVCQIAAQHACTVIWTF